MKNHLIIYYNFDILIYLIYQKEHLTMLSNEDLDIVYQRIDILNIFYILQIYMVRTQNHNLNLHIANNFICKKNQGSIRYYDRLDNNLSILPFSSTHDKNSKYIKSIAIQQNYYGTSHISFYSHSTQFYVHYNTFQLAFF